MDALDSGSSINDQGIVRSCIDLPPIVPIWSQQLMLEEELHTS